MCRKEGRIWAWYDRLQCEHSVCLGSLQRQSRIWSCAPGWSRRWQSGGAARCCGGGTAPWLRPRNALWTWQVSDSIAKPAYTAWLSQSCLSEWAAYSSYVVLIRPCVCLPFFSVKNQLVTAHQALARAHPTTAPTTSLTKTASPAQSPTVQWRYSSHFTLHCSLGLGTSISSSFLFVPRTPSG